MRMVIEKVNNLIGEGEGGLEPAISFLALHIDSMENIEIKSDFAIIKARFNNIQSQKLKGILSFDEETRETNKLYSSIQELADRIDKSNDQQASNTLQFPSEKRKKLERKIFNKKLKAYQSFSQRIWKYLQDVESFMNELTEFKGTKKEWEKNFLKTCPEFYDIAYALKDMICEYETILPDFVSDKLHEISHHAIAHVTVHFHFQSSLVINSHDKLTALYYEFIRISKMDLGLE